MAISSSVRLVRNGNSFACDGNGLPGYCRARASSCWRKCLWWVFGWLLGLVLVPILTVVLVFAVVRVVVSVANIGVTPAEHQEQRTHLCTQNDGHSWEVFIRQSTMQ